jgi:predicted nuclease of predicted toxin-antitoxin system
VKFKLDENLPASAASVLAAAGHDVDTVPGEHLAGRPDQDVVAASTAAQRVLISLDVGLGDIRAYPPGSHAGIVILRLADQSAATVIKRSKTWPAWPSQASPGRSLCCNAACCASAIPDQHPACNRAANQAAT